MNIRDSINKKRGTDLRNNACEWTTCWMSSKARLAERSNTIRILAPSRTSMVLAVGQIALVALYLSSRRRGKGRGDTHTQGETHQKHTSKPVVLALDKGLNIQLRSKKQLPMKPIGKSSPTLQTTVPFLRAMTSVSLFCKIAARSVGCKITCGVSLRCGGKYG